MQTKPSRPKAPPGRITATLYDEEYARIVEAAQGHALGRTISLLALEALDAREKAAKPAGRRQKA